MSDRIASSPFFQRLFDIFVPVMSWFLILLPVFLSPFHPAVVAYFILSFDVYFFYKSITTVYHSVLSYKTIQFNQTISYKQKVMRKDAESIQHFVIIPNYKELLHKLQDTVLKITQSDYPHKTMHLVLAFEDREEEAHEKDKKLRNEFSHYFQNIITTWHTLQPHEVAGKASNQTHAAIIVDQYVKEHNFKPEKVLITIADADSLFPKNYFSYLTCEYLKDTDRLYHFYWAPVLLYNNFWQLPFFVRMQATLSSILRLAFLSKKKNLIQISTYSTSLWLLKQINFWDVDIIPEDWHVYFQAFFKFGEKVKTIPLYTIVGGDAVYSGKFFKTFTNRYEQEKRWAWGVSDIGYAFQQSFASTHLPVLPKIKKLIFLIENHLLWPVSFFILTISAFIPPLINPVFKRTVLGFLLPQISSLILTLSTSFLLVYSYLDIKLRGKFSQKTNPIIIPFLIIQWYLLPVVTFVLSSIPALDAHTRIIFGKKLKYKVTEKI